MTDANAMVFVVDDDARVRESLKNLIRSVGLRVEAFASAQEFLRSKRRSPRHSMVQRSRSAEADITVRHGDTNFYHRLRRHPMTASEKAGRSF
jgi:DNA-binding NtrC family response regulator